MILPSELRPQLDVLLARAERGALLQSEAAKLRHLVYKALDGMPQWRQDDCIVCQGTGRCHACQ